MALATASIVAGPTERDIENHIKLLEIFIQMAAPRGFRFGLRKFLWQIFQFQNHLQLKCEAELTI